VCVVAEFVAFLLSSAAFLRHFEIARYRAKKSSLSQSTSKIDLIRPQWQMAGRIVRPIFRR